MTADIVNIINSVKVKLSAYIIIFVEHFKKIIPCRQI